MTNAFTVLFGLSGLVWLWLQVGRKTDHYKDSCLMLVSILFSNGLDPFCSAFGSHASTIF